MKRIVWILVFGFMFFFTVNSCNTAGMRSFYCLSDDKCVTIWKTGNGEVYIIPFKYKGNKTPSVSHIKTINKQFLTLYFSKEFPKKIIVRDEGNLESNKKMYSIENRVKGEWEFLEYSREYKTILYKPGATKFKDVRLNTDYITLNIQENYATDKTGKKIE
jgi:hypothetical protein